jgi:hypothetical protein
MAIIKLDGGYNALPISYKRGNPIPLDTTAVWYDYAALETYAKEGVTAYVGQVLTYVDSTKNTATAYVIADTTGTLEPIGTAPIGDNKSIVVDAETGTVSLSGIAGLTFTREVDVLGEDGQPTGEKTTENVQYQPLMTKDGLIWVEPSKTTVEGLASLIDGLTARVSALENDRVTESELAEAIKDFATDSELSEAIKDFVTDSELSEAIKDFATDSELSEAIKDFVTDTELSNAIAGVEAKIPVDNKDLANGAGYLVASDIAGKADKSNTYTKSEVDGAIDDAVKGLLGENVAEAYDTLKEIQDLLEGTDGDAIDGLIEIADANKVAIETLMGSGEGSVDAKIAAAVEPLATTEALNGVKATAEAAATKTYVDEELGKKVNASVYAEDKATFAIKSEVNAALELKANASEVVSNDIFTQFQENNTKAIADAVDAHNTTVVNTYATKGELSSLESTVDTNYAKKSSVYTTIQIDEMIAGINQGNQESASAVNTKLTNYMTSNDKEIENLKAVDVAYDTRITEAKNKAEEGANAASAAQTTANEGKALALENQTKVNNLDATVKNHTNTLTTYGTDIAGLKAHDEAHTALYDALNTTVGEHTTAIAGKASQTDLNALDARVVKNTDAISTLNDVTILGMNQEIAKKADSSSVYTKEQVNNIVGTDKPADKSLMTLIGEAKTAGETAAANLASGAVAANAAAIKAIYDADAKTGTLVTEIARVEGLVASEKSRAEGIEGDHETRIAEMELFWKSAKTDEEGQNVINTLKEIQEYITSDESGASTMAGNIQANTQAIAAIYTPASGEGESVVPASGVLVRLLSEEVTRANAYSDANLATAKKYTDDEIAKLHTVDGDTIQLKDNKAYVAKVSTDVLEQGTLELVLCGGDAGVKAEA